MRVIRAFEILLPCFMALWPDGATPTTGQIPILNDFDLGALITYLKMPAKRSLMRCQALTLTRVMVAGFLFWNSMPSKSW